MERMTREEAIKHLKDIRSDMWTVDSEVDAINMAIEVLEGDVPDTNVGDIISRQAVRIQRGKKNDVVQTT